MELIATETKIKIDNIPKTCCFLFGQGLSGEIDWYQFLLPQTTSLYCKIIQISVYDCEHNSGNL